MKKKQLWTLMLAVMIGLVFTLTPFGTSTLEAKTITLKAVSAWPKNEKSVADDYLPFLEAVNTYMEQKYPGEFKVKYTGGPEVIPSRDQPEALRMGTIDLLFGTPAYYNGIAPAANVGKLSKLTSNQEKEIGADAIFDKIHREKLGAAYLGRLGSEVQFQLYTIKPVKTVDEINGLRIRTSPMYLDFLKALGATPIGTKPGDVYQALERGVVDGMMWPAFSIRPWGWHEVAKYVVGPSFYKVCHPVLANAKKWDSLPDHIKEAFMEVLAQEAKATDERSQGKMEKEPQLLQDAGMQIITFSPEDEAKYLEMAYAEGWKGQLKMEAEYTSQLQKLLDK